MDGDCPLLLGATATPANLSDTPFKYHVFIVGCPADQDIKNEIKETLTEAGYCVSCEDGDSEQGAQGVRDAQKVLFVLTRNFIEYGRCTHLVNLACEKAESISPDMVIVARGDDITRDDLKNAGLNHTPAFRVYRLDDKNVTYLKNLVSDVSTQNLNVRPNIGSAMAYSYYYGYLSVILPGLKQRLSESGFMKGIEPNPQYKDVNLNDINMSHKFFIIIPESLKAPASFNALDSSIEDIGKIPLKLGRGGHPDRCYSSYVHQITVKDRETEKKYLFLGEFPAILINLYDMATDQKELSDNKRHLELCQFFCYLEILLEQNAACHGTYSFIFHRDLCRSGAQQIGDVIRNKIETEISAEIREKFSPTSSPQTDVASINNQMETWNIKPSEDRMKAEYIRSPLKYYDLSLDGTEQFIGKALVINNRKYTDGSQLRKGSERDEERVLDMLRDMRFDVDIYRDRTADQMWRVANTYAQESKHEGAKAFICVVMAHGKSGYLLGTDGIRVSIVKFIEVIGLCRRLKGCPKLFFIEACQEALPNDEVETNSDSRLEDDAAVDVGEVKDEGDYTSNRDLGRGPLTPCVPDVIVSIATLPGKRAYRDPIQGTLYIRHLCEVMRENRRGMELEYILKLVAENVQQEYDSRAPNDKDKLPPDQLPFFVHTLDKRLALTQ